MQSKQVLSEIAELYKAPTPVESKRVIVAEDKMIFDLGNSVELRVVETLGHASHHQSFYEKKSQGIFPGDTLGVYIQSFDAIIPTTPPPFHLETTLASIRKLKQLKPRYLFYSHFGQALKASEKLQNYDRQLRLWACITAEKIKENTTLKEVREEIEKRDPQMREISTYARTHPIINRGTIPQSIQGFMEYFKHINERISET
jgi:glyoxylase-like metal-dependent hydrolase (beta-lactamase superfamily II)